MDLLKQLGLAVLHGTPFLWAGSVLAISFMEAPVKFTSPVLDKAVAFDVGRRVFAGLNKMEWIFLSILVIAGVSKSYAWLRWKVRPGIVILMAQTFYFLPELGKRVDIYLLGQQPPESSLHLIYVIIESLKVVYLFYLGQQLFQFHSEQLSSEPVK